LDNLRLNITNIELSKENVNVFFQFLADLIFKFYNFALAYQDEKNSYSFSSINEFKVNIFIIHIKIIKFTKIASNFKRNFQYNKLIFLKKSNKRLLSLQKTCWIYSKRCRNFTGNQRGYQ